MDIDFNNEWNRICGYGGEPSKIDTVREKSEASIFLQKYGDQLTAEQRIQYQKQMDSCTKTVNPSIFESNIPIDRSAEPYASRTFAIGDSGYECDVDVCPRTDTNGVVLLFDIKNPYTNESFSLSRLCRNTNLSEEEQFILNYVREHYGCANFSEYCSRYSFDGKDIHFLSPKGNSKEVDGHNMADGTKGTGLAQGTGNSAGVDGVQGITLTPIQKVEVTEQNQQYAEAFNILYSRYNEALNALNNQFKNNGILNQLAEGVFQLWAPNGKDAAEAIKELNKILAMLQEDLQYNELELFEQHFKEQLGINFNYDAIKNYETDCQNFENISAQHAALQSFKDAYKYASDILMGSSPGHGYKEHNEEDVQQLYSHILVLYGGNEDKLKQDLMRHANVMSKLYPDKYPTMPTDWNSCGSGLKYLLLSDVFNDPNNGIAQQRQMLENWYNNAAIDVYGVTDYDDVKAAHQREYEKAYGTENKACKIVDDYCEISQIAGGIAKCVVVGTVVITTTVLTGGTLAVIAVPLSTYTAEMAISAIDEGTKQKALDILNHQGAEAYMNYMFNEVPWGQINDQAITDAAISAVFMGQACVISNICKVAGAAMGLGEKATLALTMGTQMAGDAALGSGLEYLATGEITLRGVTFTVLMDIVGNIVHIKDYCKKTVSSESDSGLGFPQRGQKQTPKLSDRGQMHDSLIEFIDDTNSLHNIRARIKHDASLSPAEKAYLEQKLKFKAQETTVKEQTYKDLKARIKNSSPKQLDELSLEIHNSDLSPAQKKQLRAEINKRVDILTKKGDIDASESDTYRFLAIDDVVAAGIDKPSILTESNRNALQGLKNPVEVEEMINMIIERMAKGELPSKEMLEIVIAEMAQKTGIKDKILYGEMQSAMKRLSKDESIWNYIKYSLEKPERMVGRNKSLLDGIKEFIEKKNVGLDEQQIIAKQNAQQAAELKAKQEEELQAKLDAELKAKQEEELRVQKEAELKAQQETKAKMRVEQKRLLEKYPELENLPFRDDESLIELGRVLEEYELYLQNNTVDYNNYRDTDLYQRLSNIKKDADVDIAFDYMKQKYHSDVVAEESRIKEVMEKYNFDDEELVQVSDKVIKHIKDKQANGESVSPEEVDFMISDIQSYNFYIKERIKFRIIDELNLQ